MESHATSTAPAAPANNVTASLHGEMRQSSRVADSRSLVSDGANVFYAEETPLDPQMQSSNVTDSFSYYDYPRGSLTFGTGFGEDTNGARIEIPGNDGTSYTVPASDTANIGLDAMSRFEKTPDPNPWLGPHTVEGMRGWKTTSQIIPRPQDAYPGYRDGPISDIGTSYSHVRHDSGYLSRSYHESEHLSQQGEDTRSMIQRVEHARMVTEGISLEFSPAVNLSMNIEEDMGDVDASTSASNHVWSAQTNTSQRRCEHAACRGTKPMNPSEFKKHMQRHEKPFRCSESSCKRFIHGFATPNDLQRHTKSVHNALSTSANERSYICKGLRCAHKSKVWPRLDNFKAHCKRRHASEDLEVLIRRSAFDVKTKKFFTDTNHRHDVADADDSSTDPFVPGIGKIDATVGVDAVTLLGASSLQRASDELANTGPPDRLEDALARPEQIHPRLLDVHAQTSQISGTGPSKDSAQDPTELLAGLLTGIFSREGSQMWRAGLEELERDLVSDFSEAQQRGQQPTPNELGAIVTSRIMDFFKSPRKRLASDAGLDTADGTERKHEYSVDSSEPLQARSVRCNVCGKELNRLCDLKKHEKRHSRPWGCTEEKCDKTFGSKNDWKRHENSQHYQLETWRCHEPCQNNLIGVCAKTFSRPDPFRSHLRKEHEIKDETYMREQCRQRRIGKNGQDRFWCGFCRAIVKLQQKGLKAFDERFNHIDDYHFKKGEGIELWYPVDKDVPKGQLGRKRNAFKRETMDDGDPSRLVEENECSTDGSDDETDLSIELHTSSSPPPPPTTSLSEGRSVWSSPSRSFSDDGEPSATKAAPHGSRESEKPLACTNRRRARISSRADSVTSDPRQASLYVESEGKEMNARVCRGCSAPVNPDIDTSCPDCGIRLASEVPRIQR